MADGVFRRKKGFTVIQNSVAWDVNVSIKAKGLYLIIQSNITRPDKTWKKSEFMRFMKEGEKLNQIAHALNGTNYRYPEDAERMKDALYRLRKVLEKVWEMY